MGGRQRVRSGSIASIAALVVMLGCATTSVTGETKPNPDDLAAGVVEKLVGAYDDRDVSGFMTLVSARYLQGYEDLQTALEGKLETAVSVDLQIDPERVWEAENDKVFMDAAWRKSITRSSAADIEMTSGRVTFTFIRYDSDVLKLFSQGGDPVFP